MDYKTPKNATDELVTKVTAPDGQVHEIVQYEVLHEGPTGKVDVEIRSETGRLEGKAKGENFVSKLWSLSARSVQQLMYSGFLINSHRLSGVDGPMPPNLGNTNHNAGLRRPFRFPHSMLALWNDASAENPGWEHRIMTDAQGIVAAAFRFPTASLQGNRGSVSVVDTYHSEDYDSFVAEWPTVSGNGTFQSIGWVDGGVITAALDTQYMIPCLKHSYEERVYRFMTGSTDGSHSDLMKLLTANQWPGSMSVASIMSIYSSGGGCFDAGGNWIMGFRNTTPGGTSPSTTSLYLMRFGVAGFIKDDAGVDYVYGSHGAHSSPMGSHWSHMVTATDAGFTTYPKHFLLGEYSGAIWVLGRSTSIGIQNHYLTSINKLTGAVGTWTNIGSFSHVNDGCIIGSNVWIASNDGTIRRVDISGGTPSVTATINPSLPPDGATNQPIASMCTDGTDLWVYYDTRGVYHINTSGTVLHYYGHSPMAVNTAVSGSSPWSTNLYTCGDQTWTLSNATEGTYGSSAGYPGGSMGTWTREEAYPRFPGHAPTHADSLGISIPAEILTGPSQLGGSGYSVNAVGGGLRIIDGKLCWMKFGGVAYAGSTPAGLTKNGFCLSFAELGYNLGSRVLLDSPLTKATSQTMKVTYNTTWPKIV